MKMWMTAILAFLLSVFAYAQDTSSTIRYTGQSFDDLELARIAINTHYRDEVVDSTCTRQIPYVTQECSNETRYRRQCNWVPGQNICRTENRRVCRNVTRTRRECSPGGRVCRMTPPTRVCRNGQCKMEPPRRVCDRTGQPVCRNVPYQTQECRNEPQRVCHTEPGRNVCSQVPYQEYVCRDVTRYRSEEYSCKKTIQVPYQVRERISSNVEISYDQNDVPANVQFNYSLLESGDVQVTIEDNSYNPVFVEMFKDVDYSDETTSRINYRFKFYSKNKVLLPVNNNIRLKDLRRGRIDFSTGLVTNPENVSIRVKIIRDGVLSKAKTKFDQTFSANDLIRNDNDLNSDFRINLSNYGVNLNKRKHEVEITTMINFQGTLLNGLNTPYVKKQYFKTDVD